jgi:hypothetical protein
MKLELEYVIGLIRNSAPGYHAGAIGIISALMNDDCSPFQRLRNVRTVLAALETVLAENSR